MQTRTQNGPAGAPLDTTEIHLTPVPRDSITVKENQEAFATATAIVMANRNTVWV